jgi:MFS family permease
MNSSDTFKAFLGFYSGSSVLGMNRPAILGHLFPFGELSLDLRLLCVSNFIGAFGDGLFVYILPNYIRGLEATSADVGFLFSLLSLTTALTIIPGGFLADRFDRKKIMILGWLVWAPLPLAFSAASHWSQLIVPMCLYGALLSGPAISAYVATTTSKERMTLTFTSLSASWSLGYIFSPAFGGYLASFVDMRWVFFLGFVFYSIATGVLFFVRSQHVSKSVNLGEASRTTTFPMRRLIFLSLFFAAATFSLSLVRPLVVQFFNDIFTLNNFQIGILGSVTFFGWTIFSIQLGRLGDRRDKMIAVAASLLMASVSFSLLISSGFFPSLILASFLSGATFPVWALMNACISALAPEASRGRWISLSQVTVTFAAFAAPYLGGVLYEHSPYTPFYLVIVVTPIIAVLGLTRPFRQT